MERATSFAIALLCAMAAAAGDNATRLNIEGVCSIDAPAGYTWHPLQLYDGHKGGQYICEAPNKAGRLILQIDPRHAGNQNVRSATLKMHFNTLVQTLKKSGFTDLKGEPPSFDPPIPDNVGYTVAGTSGKGQARVFNGHTIFGNHTYFLEAVSTSLSDAEQMGSVAKSLKEPEPPAK